MKALRCDNCNTRFNVHDDCRIVRCPGCRCEVEARDGTPPTDASTSRYDPWTLDWLAGNAQAPPFIGAFALLVLLCFASPAGAQSYVHLPSHAVTYHSASGYYQYGGQYYSRYWFAPYTSYGVYYPGYYAYSLVSYTPAKEYTVQDLINIRGKEIADVSKAKAYADAAAVLWPNGVPTAVNGYGAYPNAFEYKRIDIKQFQGVNTQADIINNKDFNLALQQAGLVAKDLNITISDTQRGLLAIAQLDSQTVADAQTMAIALEMVRIIKGQAKTTTTQQSLRITPTIPQPGPAIPAPTPKDGGNINLPDEQIDALAAVVFAQRCGDCHGPQVEAVRAGKRMNIAAMDKMDLKGLEDLADRVSPDTKTKDPARFMPRRKDGTPGEILPQMEYAVMQRKLEKLAAKLGK